MLTTAQFLTAFDTIDAVAAGPRADIDQWATAWRYPYGAAGVIADVIRARAHAADRVAAKLTPIERHGPTGDLTDRLWLRGFNKWAIARTLQCELDPVESYLRMLRRDDDDQDYHARIVWAEHCKGRTVMDMANEHGISRDTAYRVLKHEGVEANVALGQVGETKDRKIARMYRDGATYPKIAKACGMSMSSLKRRLQALYEAGDLPEYGKRPGGRPPKETTT